MQKSLQYIYETPTLSPRDTAEMNELLRHKLRNHCAGLEMTLLQIQQELEQHKSPLANRCEIIFSELNNLNKFSSRLDLIFAKLPAPKKLTLSEIIHQAQQYCARQYPRIKLRLEGEQNSISFAKGSWILIAIIELLDNAIYASDNNDILFTWGNSPFQFSIVNSGHQIAKTIPLNEPKPFYTTSGGKDGLGLAITTRMAQKSGFQLSFGREANNTSAILSQQSHEVKNA